jgi:hypothetical protein
MGFQSIFAWKGLPEAAFAKNVVIDFYPSFHEGFAGEASYRNARLVLPQASKPCNLPRHRARGSVRRASGFVLTGNAKVIVLKYQFLVCRPSFLQGRVADDSLGMCRAKAQCGTSSGRRGDISIQAVGTSWGGYVP